MDITNWKDTWGTVNWKSGRESEILQKIKALYYAGVDFNMYDDSSRTPLMYAAQYSTPEVIDLLIDGGADITLKDKEESNTCLHLAVQENKKENIQYLIDRAPKDFVNVKNKYGCPALFNAVQEEELEITKVLIKNGADVNIRSNGNESAFTLAAAVESVELLKELIRAGADVNARNSHGWSALHVAVFHKDVEMVDFLINEGVKLDIKNNDGYTALNIAVRHSRADIVEKLVDAGANMNIKNREGWTILESAAYYGNAKTVKVLIEHGAVDTKGRAGCLADSGFNLEVKEILKVLENAEQIRADYLATHPEKENSLHQILPDTLAKQKRIALIQNKKTR